MKASKMINFLDGVIKQYGDLEVGCMNHEYGASHVAGVDCAVSNSEVKIREELKDEAELGNIFIRIK